MERGNFEQRISDKLAESGEIKAPSGVWSGIEAELNSGLVVAYSTRNKRYKWIAVAAVLIAFCSIGNQLFIQFKSNQTTSIKNYNAIVNSKYNLKKPNLLRAKSNYLPTFIPVIAEAEKNSTTKDEFFEKIAGEIDPRPKVVPLPTNIERKQVLNTEPKLDASIYEYSSILQGSNKVLKGSRNKYIWAGVEAGAGNFTTLNTPNILFGSDQTGLATAISSDNFINPTTIINSELNDGLVTTAGVDVGMRIGDKWTLETGVSYTNVEFTGEAVVNIIDTYTLNSFSSIALERNADAPAHRAEVTIQEKYDYDLEVFNTTQFTSIPIQMGYNLMKNNSKMSFKLNFGIAANYLMTSSLKDNLGILNASLEDSFNQWSFDGLGGVEIGYSVFENFNLVLAPNYRQAIRPLTDDMLNEGRFTVQTGIQYVLK